MVSDFDIRPGPAVFGLPGLGDWTETWVRELEAKRRERPFSRLPPGRFDALLTGAKEWLAYARALEPSAASDDQLALTHYKMACDKAQACCIAARDEALTASGRKESTTQAKRREDKPASSDWDTDAGRNDRIRAQHARLKAGGERDATAQVATEFSMSESQIRRIVAKGKRA